MKRREFRFGEGKIAAVVSLFLSGLSLLGVICFHFPALLTTPELRQIYSVELLRTILASAIFLGFVFGLISFLLSKNKYAGVVGMVLAGIATLLGGSTVTVPGSVTSSHYLGLDWFILDLLIVALIFIPLERVFARLKSQRVFRDQWKTDLIYFFVSHVLVQVTGILILAPSLSLGRMFELSNVHMVISRQPIWIQFFEILVIADFMQYWVHFAFHRIRFLWKFHAIHHSATDMDWLAGSRLHLVDVVVTRGISLIPLFLLGFAEGAMKAYLVFVAMVAVFIHTNIKYRFWNIRKVLATPLYHHWHHADEKAAIDKNFAVHLPLFDLIFGTYYLPSRWPRSYGVSGEKIPETFFEQTVYPFQIRKTRRK